jgi:hypothetical protein
MLLALYFLYTKENMVPDGALPQSFRMVARCTTKLSHRVGPTGDVTDLGEDEVFSLELKMQQRGPVVECGMNMGVLGGIASKNAQAFTANTNYALLRSFCVL